MHSKNFEMIKKYYENYLNGNKPAWDQQRVYNVVGKPSGITPKEYEEITGVPYIPVNGGV